jgi:ABC-type cobalamin/Fe3+-siderophores transport system ATPase subunit
LDIAGEKSIMQLVDEVHARHNVAVVMVTHSLNTVANHARHIGIINNGAFEFHEVHEVMQTEYLCRFYGVPVQVLEVDGKRVVM